MYPHIGPCRWPLCVHSVLGWGGWAASMYFLETHRRIAPLGRFIKKVVRLEEKWRFSGVFLAEKQKLPLTLTYDD